MNYPLSSVGKSIFYALFGAVPIFLWLTGEGTELIFDGFYNSLTTIGQAAALVGVSFFSGNLILSGRYKFMDRLFGGLDKVFLFHRTTGKLTLYLLSLHVLTVSVRYFEIGSSEVWNFISNFSRIELIFSRISYFGLLVIVLVTLFVKMKYERKKFIHKFLGLFLFFGGLHAFLIPTHISFNMPLRFYILSIIGIALLSFAGRTIFTAFFVKRIVAGVIAVNNLGGNVTEIVMKVRAGRVPFLPGQFIFVAFDQPGFVFEEHPFSITSSAESEDLRISAKGTGDYTKEILPTLKKGAAACIQGPFGGFTNDAVAHKKQVWIAGGIGITPFMSMARTMRDRNNTAEEIDLIWSVQTRGDAIYEHELSEISNSFPRMRLHLWVTKEKGYITVDDVTAMASITGKEIFICGPQALLSSFSKKIRHNFPSSRVHFELFKLY